MTRGSSTAPARAPWARTTRAEKSKTTRFACCLLQPTPAACEVCSLQRAMATASRARSKHRAVTACAFAVPRSSSRSKSTEAIVNQVESGLNRVRARLATALAGAGRAPDAARLVAVSKFQPAAAIRAAYAAGQRDFGENYVQELAQKAAELSDLRELRWHMIGHLQRNKARLVVPLISLPHTVHSVELVRELDKRVSAEGRLSVLVEVNVGGEAQKSGCEPGALADVLHALGEAAHLTVSGLMCVPP